MSRIIKKYKNRRLYDTKTSHYINIDQLKTFVVDGEEFHIVDSSSNKDITTATLLQIIVEMEGGQSQFLSPIILRQIICLANHPMHASLKSMMEQLFQTMEKPLKTNPYKEASDAWNKQMQDMMQKWQTVFKQ